MKLSRGAMLTLLLPALSVLPHTLAFAGAREDCGGARGYYNEFMIKGCTQLIQSGETWAYRPRAGSYAAIGNLDRAIADYDQAIGLSSKAPGSISETANLYAERGVAYEKKGDPDRAIADYDQAIKLRPIDPDYYSRRGQAYLDKKDFERAIADFNERIAKYLNWGGTSRNDSLGQSYRGIANYYAGRLPNALEDFTRAVESDSRFFAWNLWLEIASRRSKLPSRLPELAARVNDTGWPAPLLRLYLDQSTAEAVLAAAAGDPYKTCLANFYIGERALLQGSRPEAARYFEGAVSTCSKDVIEWTAARFELEALKQ